MKQATKKTKLHFFLFFLAVSVHSLGGFEENRPQTGTVVHLVLCWLNEPGNEESISKLVKASESFRSIPGVLEVRTGTPLISDRPVVDSSYDIAIMITFSSAEALADYQKHPLHQQASADILKPLVKRLLVYDVEVK